MLVEDEYLTAMYAEQALLDAGFEVIGPAATAEQAIELASAERPDVVIMDIRLAGERDGVEAATEIFHTTGIRCVFVSAYSTPEIRDRANSIEPLAWVLKPYTSQALVQAVRDALTSFEP
ncbi:MAG: response regulator [Alphaproteobacteria bacterium]